MNRSETFGRQSERSLVFAECSVLDTPFTKICHLIERSDALVTDDDDDEVDAECEATK